MQNKNGFFLIEWMVHFFILIIIVIMTSALIMSWQKNSSQLNRLLAQLLPMYIATDLIRRDVHNAQKVTIQENALHIFHDHTRITWRVAQGKLMRIVSSYDAKHQMWLQPMSSLIATDISDMTCHQYESVKSSAKVVSCSFNTAGNKIPKVFVAERNGVIL